MSRIINPDAQKSCHPSSHASAHRVRNDLRRRREFVFRWWFLMSSGVKMNRAFSAFYVLASIAKESLGALVPVKCDLKVGGKIA